MPPFAQANQNRNRMKPGPRPIDQSFDAPNQNFLLCASRRRTCGCASVLPLDVWASPMHLGSCGGPRASMSGVCRQIFVWLSQGAGCALLLHLHVKIAVFCACKSSDISRSEMGIPVHIGLKTAQFFGGCAPRPRLCGALASLGRQLPKSYTRNSYIPQMES